MKLRFWLDIYPHTTQDCPPFQNQNKVNSGVRCIHPPSSARGEARDNREQIRNRRAAFKRCVSSPEFQKWLKIDSAKRMGELADVDRKVDEQMRPENLKIEYL